MPIAIGGYIKLIYFIGGIIQLFKDMQIISEKITSEELKKIALSRFGILIKAVVDIERNIIALDAEFHSDLEKLLLSDGSKQSDLWGINLYPQEHGEDFLEYDSMINLRPGQGNKTRGVDDPRIREKIEKLIAKLVQK